MLAYDKMDELSEAFGRALFLAFADWEPLAIDIGDEKSDARHMEVDIPQEGTDRRLHLSTAGKEITIAFDYWHTHIGPFLGISIAESVNTALSIIESFVTEQTVVRVFRRDGVWIGSGLAYRAAPPTELKPHSTTEVFSWRCTYDQTIETP